MPDFHVGIRLAPRLDAIEPVLDMPEGDKAFALPLGLQFSIGAVLHEILGIGRELIAVDLHLALVADEDPAQEPDEVLASYQLADSFNS